MVAAPRMTIGDFMHRALAAGLAILLMTATADAAELTVFSSGVTHAALVRLGAAWSRQTGNSVNVTNGNVGTMLEYTNSDRPGDLVLLLPKDAASASARLMPGTTLPVGRALFGLAAKAGAPRPDISTLEKFAAVLRAAASVGHPSGTSMSGAMIAQMLKRPEFAGVRALPLRENAETIAARGDAQYGAGTISEELSDPGAELVGLFPAALDMHIDFSAAVLARTASPEAALSFLRFITAPAAAAGWHACGIERPEQDPNAPRERCAP
jgi:molybdate transport system substrate-binding protein